MVFRRCFSLMRFAGLPVMMSRPFACCSAAFVSGLIFCGELAAADQGKLPEIAPVKAWRVARSGAAAKQFIPVLEENSIEIGNKTVQMFPNGSFRCMSREHGSILTVEMPYFWAVKNGTEVWGWRNRNLDMKKSKLTREGNKYTWELWFKDENLPPFPGITQSLEVLSDGRLALSYRYSFPADTPEYKFKFWTQTFNLPESCWLNENVSLSGGKAKMDPAMPDQKEWERNGKLEWIFGEDQPSKRFSVRVVAKPSRMMHLRCRKDSRSFQIIMDGPKNGRTSIVYMDFRTGVEKEKNKDLRNDVDFKLQENMTMPDNRHKNLLRNPSFEGGLEGWIPLFFAHDRQWFWKPFELDEKVAFEGKNSLRMNVLKISDWSAVNANISPQIVIAEPGFYTVSFWYKGEKDKKSTISVWLPSHTDGNYPPAIHNNTAQWHFPAGEKWQRGQFSFELKKMPETHLAVCFYGQDESGKGTIWLDAVQLEKGKRATAYQAPPAEGRLLTSDPENFISSKNKIDGRFRITTAKPDMSGQARITVKNFFGEILLDLKKDFRTGQNRTAEFALPLDTLPGLGVFVVKGEYKLADSSEACDFRRYAKIEFQEQPRPNKRIFAIDYRNTSVRNNFVTRLERWKKLGVGSKHWVSSIRKEDWEMYEKYGVTPYALSMLSYVYRETTRGSGRGISHFAISDPERMGEGHLKLNDPRVFIYDYHIEAGGKITPAYLEKLKNVAAMMAKKYPFVRLWLLGGEVTAKLPNDWWGKGDTDKDVARKHALLLKAFTEGVHEGNPKAMVFQDCPSNMSPTGGIAETDRLLAECNKLGVKFDVIAIHPYRFSPENPDLDSDTRKFLDVLDRNGYGKTRVLWTEGMLWGPYDVPQWGTSSSDWNDAPGCWKRGPMTYDMGWTEKRTAAWYARAWLVALKYADRILGATSGSTINSCYMDILQTPYAAQLSSNTLCCILGDAKFKKDIRFAPYTRAYVFEDARKRPVAAVWCHHPDVDNGKADAPVFAADFGSSLETVLDFMNSPRAFKPGRMEFPVSPFPLFLRGKPGTLGPMIRALEQAEQISGSSTPPLGISADPLDMKSARVTFKNQVSREFVGKFNGQDLRVPASGQTAVNVPLNPPLNDKAVTHVKLPVELKTAAGMDFKQDFEFDAIPVRRVPDNATVDSLEWSTLPAVPITKKSHAPKTSGFFRTGWNSAGLFLEVTVKDAKFLHVEYPDPYNRYKNDCVQVYFDTFANARRQIAPGYDRDDYDYAIFPNSRGTSAQIFRYRTVDTQLGLATDAPPDRTFAPDMPCRFTNKDGVLTYRAFFPAKYLLPMKLQKGWVFGFALYVADSNREGKLDGALSLASDGKGCYDRPHTWPAAVLVE